MIYKRLFISLSLLLCLLLNLKAEEISKEKAFAYAKSFFLANDALVTKGAEPQLKLVLESMGTPTKGISDPALYIFNRTDHDGFVIISGESATYPVLGYSMTGSFKTENMPVNIEQWILGISDEINYLRTSGIQQSSFFAQQWNNDAPDFGEVVIQYQTAKWDQTYPYNKYCPTINGVQAVTGCTATALAIVLKSRRWPDCGVGTVPSYTYDYNGQNMTIPERKLGHAYEWDKMPDILTSRSSEEEIHQVATLMKDCGLISKSEYTDGETGADSQNSIKGLIDHMKYSPNAQHVFRYMYTHESWLKLLREELKYNGPVFFGGKNSWFSGHAFVLDGYTSKDYYGINWGWGGSCDGYYLITALVPDEHGIAADGASYNTFQHAIVGLNKAMANDKPDIQPFRLSYHRSNVDYLDELRVTCGMLADTRNIQSKVPFKIHSGSIRIMPEGSSFNGQVQLMLLNQYGEVKEMVGKAQNFSYQQWWLMFESTQEYVINSVVEDTDYLAYFYKSESDTEWIQIKGEQGCNDRINLMPNTMATYYDQVVIFDDYGSIGEGTIWANTESITENKKFYMSVGELICVYGDFFAEYAYAVFDKHGVFKDSIIMYEEAGYGADFFNWHFSRGYYTYADNTPCMITQQINDGDYIAAAYKKSGEEVWNEIYGYSYSVTKIPLTPSESMLSLSESSLDYYRTSGKMVITTQADVSYDMKDTSGKTVSSGTSSNSGTITILTSPLSSGDYILTLRNDKEKFSISIKL